MFDDEHDCGDIYWHVRRTDLTREQYRECAFCRVKDEHQTSATPSHVAINVQRSHVATAEFLDIYVFDKPGDEIGWRESTKEVGNRNAKNKQRYI